MRSILFLAAATAICLSGAVFAQDANSNSGELQASGSEPPPVSESQPVTDAGGATETIDDSAPIREFFFPNIAHVIPPEANPPGADAGSDGSSGIVGDVVGDVGSIPDYIGADPASAAGSPGIVGRPDSG